MADTFLFFGLFIFSVCEISGLVKNTPKPISASAGRSFVFSAKNRFSFSNSKSASKEIGNADTGGSQGISSQSGHGSQQQSGWKQQEQQQQQTNPTSLLSQQQIQQQQFQRQQGSSMGTSDFQTGQQFGMSGQQANPNTFNQHQNHGQQQPNNFNQMKQGFNQQHFSQQQQSTNMNPGRSQMFHQGSQQQQQQQQLQSFGQQNNVPNGHNTQFRQTHKFNQFNGQPSGNGINVFSQNKPSNMPPFQGINMMPHNQHGFQGNPQGQLTQYNPQPHGMINNGQGFNQNSGQQGHMQRHQSPMLGQPRNQMGGHNPGMQRNHMAVPSPHSQMQVQGGGQMPNPQNNNMPRQVGQMPPPTQAGQQGHGPPYKPNLNLAVIDHPMKATTPTTTPKPPTSTVDGEGFVCMTTADCEIGCCFNSTGQLLDTTTYGAGGLREGRASGKCFIRSPGLGDVCDDLCPCQMGHSCYRRYAPNYPKPGEKAPPPIDPESAPKPQRKCLRSAVVEAERSSFWRCYFDVACSGPLP